MKYRLIVVESKEGFAVHCPSLPGCWAQGRSEAEGLENIRAAIRDYVEVREELNIAEYTEGGARAYIREIELPSV